MREQRCQWSCWNFLCSSWSHIGAPLLVWTTGDPWPLPPGGSGGLRSVFAGLMGVCPTLILEIVIGIIGKWALGAKWRVTLCFEFRFYKKVYHRLFSRFCITSNKNRFQHISELYFVWRVSKVNGGRNNRNACCRLTTLECFFVFKGFTDKFLARKETADLPSTQLKKSCVGLINSDQSCFCLLCWSGV